MQIDLRVLELLSSKLCHDLVSPISAINNGVELVEDVGGEVVEEAMQLIGDSAGHASRRLRLFRMAYGRAGDEDNLNLKDVRQVAEQYMAGGKITLSWPEDQPMDALASQRGFLKTLLNLVLMSEEILAYGGAVSLKPVTEDRRDGFRFEIVGRNAQLSDQTRAALEGKTPVDELSPRSIQSYITGKFAEHFNLKLVYGETIPDRLDLSLFGAEAMVVAA